MNRIAVIKTLFAEATRHERVAMVTEGIISKDHLNVAARLREAAEIINKRGYNYADKAGDQTDP